MSSYSSSTPTSSLPMMPGKGGNSTAAAAAAAAASAAAKKASLLKQALVQRNNERAPWAFAIAMGGLIVLFTLFHWSRYFYSRHCSKGLRQSFVMRYQVATARYVEHLVGLLLLINYLEPSEMALSVRYLALRL
jgi:hypothetical protein